MNAPILLASRLAAAPSELTARLMEIWCRTLRVETIAPDSDFFALGGDSLLAVGLFLEIEREWGRNFPITTIYDAPTVAELAALIETEAAPDFSPLVLLKPGESGAPFFIVHGIGGTVMELATLGRNIRIREPVYAIQARGLDGRAPPLESVDDMADLYVDWIRQRQPVGPYWLCGYSFGGLVALEMARRLKAKRQEIALLILMDAYAHPATWPLVSRIKMRTRRTLHRMGESAKQPLATLPHLLLHQSRQWLDRVRARISREGGTAEAMRAARLRDWLLNRNPDLPLPLLKVREAGSAALASYVPQFYPGKITFLKAAGRDPEFPDDPERIWRNRLVKEFELHSVPGDHRSIVTVHAESVAARLAACVAQARGRRAQRPSVLSGIIRQREPLHDRRLTAEVA
jgi:thioesterase domain-containing protein/acyl carrier protein